MARPKAADKPKAPKKPKAKRAPKAKPAPVQAAEPAPEPAQAQEQPIHGNSAFTPEIASAICELIAQSYSLNRALKQLGNPVNRATVFRWLEEHKIFRDQYARAHEMQADFDADEIREITRRVIGPHEEGEAPLTHQDARLAIDALKWSASKRQPKKYGEKVEIDTPEDSPIAKAVGVTMGALAALAEKASKG